MEKLFLDVVGEYLGLEQLGFMSYTLIYVWIY